MIRSSKHLPTDVRREANIGQRRFTQMISLKLSVIPKIHDEHREVVVVEMLIHNAVNTVIAA